MKTESVPVNIDDIIVRLADRMAFTDDCMNTTTQEIRDLINDIEKEG